MESKKSVSETDLAVKYLKFFLNPTQHTVILHYSKGENTSDDKIVGGQDAILGQFPWQVVFLHYGSVMCGGTIYNERTIITAAHCCHV